MKENQNQSQLLVNSFKNLVYHQFCFSNISKSLITQITTLCIFFDVIFNNMVPMFVLDNDLFECLFLVSIIDVVAHSLSNIYTLLFRYLTIYGAWPSLETKKILTMNYGKTQHWMKYAYHSYRYKINYLQKETCFSDFVHLDK